jgi:hypothetical protein
MPGLASTAREWVERIVDRLDQTWPTALQPLQKLAKYRV